MIVGYENGNTGKILDTLKTHHAKATFFVVGNFITSNPELVKRIHKEGHIVGNHTYHHPDMSKIATKEAFEKELKDVETAYKQLTGEKMTRFYRPPQGKYSISNLKMAKETGYHTFFWSLAYVDCMPINSQQREAFKKLLPRIHPVLLFYYIILLLPTVPFLTNCLHAGKIWVSFLFFRRICRFLNLFIQIIQINPPVHFLVQLLAHFFLFLEKFI